MRKSLSVFSASFCLFTTQLCVTGCGDDTPSEDAGVQGCPEPTGAGTEHGPFLDSSEVWSLEDSPHRLPNGLTIASGVELSIEACAVVRVGGGYDINVNGKLFSNGETDRPVVFERLESGSAWGSIVSIRVDSPLHLFHTVLDGGGGLAGASYPEQHGVIRIEASIGEALDPMLEVDEVTIRGSEANGVHLTYNAAFTEGSKGLSIEDVANYPIVTNPWSASTIPPGSYTGNGRDAILVRTAERLGIDGLIVDATWDDHGIPYEIGGDTDAEMKQVVIGAPMLETPAKLTLVEGVELRFNPTGGIVVQGAQASLVAVGSLTAPIVFTSASEVPTAGDWLGLNFRYEVSPGTIIAFAKILYAGNENTSTRSFSCGTPKAAPTSQQQTMGAVYFSLDADVGPPSTFVQTTEIRYSASNGFDRGWTGEAIDMIGTNTLSDIAFCAQTDPHPEVGACSDPPMCPEAN